ncbi:hypothetical protein V8D89_002751 [Ganoderma adspersum]
MLQSTAQTTIYAISGEGFLHNAPIPQSWVPLPSMRILHLLALYRMDDTANSKVSTTSASADGPEPNNGEQRAKDGKETWSQMAPLDYASAEPCTHNPKRAASAVPSVVLSQAASGVLQLSSTLCAAHEGLLAVFPTASPAVHNTVSARNVTDSVSTPSSGISGGGRTAATGNGTGSGRRVHPLPVTPEMDLDSATREARGCASSMESR